MPLSKPFHIIMMIVIIFLEWSFFEHPMLSFKDGRKLAILELFLRGNDQHVPYWKMIFHPHFLEN